MRVLWSRAGRTVHNYEDDRSNERCNLDQIRQRNRVIEETGGDVVGWAKERALNLCLRCFPDMVTAHITDGRPLPGQGLVAAIPTAAPPVESRAAHLERVTTSAPPQVDHLEPTPGDGLTPTQGARDGAAIPEDLVHVNMDTGPRFEGGGDVSPARTPEPGR